MATTTHYGLVKPDETKDVNEEFFQLQQTLDTLDTILHGLDMDVGGKAPASHTHEMGDILGLINALNAKMSSSVTFKLDSLTDVDGADAAPNGYVLYKTAGGWVPVSAATAMGNHNHTTAQVNGLDAALAAKLDDSQLDVDASLTANSDAKISSQKAVKSYVDGLINTLKGGVSATFDTLKELADNFANYLPLSGGTVSGNVRATTFTARSNSGSLNTNVLLEKSDGTQTGGLIYSISDDKVHVRGVTDAGVTQSYIALGRASASFEFNGARVATEDNVGNVIGASVIQGAVGAIQMLAHGAANTALVYGTNYAGSALRLCSLHADASGVYPGISATAPSGTWKSLGTIAANASRQSISLFLRIA